MLNRERLQLAIDIQSRSYKLLRWIETALKKGLLLVSQAEKHSDTSEAAVEWIAKHCVFFPVELQPGQSNLREFANFFWTFLITSFDVVAHPGTRLEPSESGCMCPLCARIKNAPYLQPKKLAKGDKRRALELMAERIADLAREEHLSVGPDRCQEIANDPETRRAAGFSAYGYWLINRLSGQTDGPSILALWREIAWRREGSPIHGFKVRYEDFEISERLLIQALQRDNHSNADSLVLDQNSDSTLH